MSVKVSNLKDLFGTTHRPFLRCEKCGNEASAHKGDYFMFPSNHEFMCCDEPMRLVKKEVRYVDAK